MGVPANLAERWQRPAALLAFAALGAILAFRLAQYLALTSQTIPYPFQLDYGEGIVWQQMRAIVSGHGYAPIEGFPAIVFHYPPVYHLVSAAVAQLTGIDQLFAGRLVSMVSTLVVAVLLARIMVVLAPSAAPRRATLLAAAITALITFTIQPVEFWSLYMRVDLLCTALVLGGLVLGLKAIEQPRCIIPAAILFVLAVYTKQTAIAAPAAVFGTLLFVRPQTALAGIGTAVVLGLCIMAAMLLWTDGGFIRHILFYNINRVDLHGLLIIVANINDQLALTACGLIGVIQQVKFARRTMVASGSGGLRGFVTVLRTDRGQARRVMVLAYLAICTLMLGMIAKSGAADNYLIEWNCLLALFAGLAFAELIASLLPSEGAARATIMAVLLPALFCLQLVITPALGSWLGKAMAFRTDETAAVVDTIRAAPQPVISDDMVALLRGGKPVLWESAIFAELASIGVWDETPFLNKIRARQFAFFVITNPEDKRLIRSRYTPAVQSAIESAYPNRINIGTYQLRFPAGPLPAYAEPLTHRPR